jgi:hypothetical protein
MPSGFKFEISSNMAYVKAHLAEDLHRVIRPSYQKAANRALTSAKTEAVRRLAKAMGVKVTPIRKAVTVEKVTKNSLEGALVVSQRPQSGANTLSANPKTREKSGRGHLKGGGVNYKAWGKPQHSPKAFIMSATGGQGDSRRSAQAKTQGDQKYFIAIRHATGKITSIYGPWAPREFSSKKGQKRAPGVDFYTTIKINEVFARRYVYEVNRSLERIFKGKGYRKLVPMKSGVDFKTNDVLSGARM